jgi:hypothetical protein
MFAKVSKKGQVTIPKAISVRRRGQIVFNLQLPVDGSRWGENTRLLTGNEMMRYSFCKET